MPGEESQCALEILQKNIAKKYFSSYLLCCLPVLKARARLELREVATEQDAKDVVEIMKFRSTQFM